MCDRLKRIMLVLLMIVGISFNCASSIYAIEVIDEGIRVETSNNNRKEKREKKEKEKENKEIKKRMNELNNKSKRDNKKQEKNNRIVDNVKKKVESGGYTNKEKIDALKKAEKEYDDGKNILNKSVEVAHGIFNFATDAWMDCLNLLRKQRNDSLIKGEMYV